MSLVFLVYCLDNGFTLTMTRWKMENALVVLVRLEVTLHWLRCTFYKMLVAAGEGVGKIVMLAGHEKLNMTSRYTMPGMTDLDTAVEKLMWEKLFYRIS
ncbi:MAG: hypothetical protein K6T65_03810 [Peptococcaceae bacterium]|nr:hypothetical protein [Peptococcaceae bacterium]